MILRRVALPSTAAWQARLDELGADLELDPKYATSTHSGFWPVRLGDGRSGFEFYLHDGIDPAVGPAPGPAFDVTASFVTHSDLTELRVSMLAAAALSSVSDGVAFDPQARERLTPESLLAEAAALGETEPAPPMGSVTDDASPRSRWWTRRGRPPKRG